MGSWCSRSWKRGGGGTKERSRKRVLSSRVSGREGYIGEGGQPEVDQGPQAPPGAPYGVAAPGGRLGHPWLPSGPTWALREASCMLVFPIFFQEFFRHFKKWE